MVEALDASVVTLERIAIGSIGIGKLAAGTTRVMTAQEVNVLKGVGSRGSEAGGRKRR
jgi:16S rRNA U516 pseudouridylate synthase RsuA-like enzyme